MRNEHRIKKKHRIIKEFDNQHGRLDLHFRAHTVPTTSQAESWAGGHVTEAKNAVIFHCVSTADETQDLLFGAYISAELQDGKYAAREIGLFCRDGHPEELRVFK